MGDVDRIVDECIDRIGQGESLEACLSRYPEHAKQLEPLLRAVIQIKAVYSFTPSVGAKREARQRFFSAMERQDQPILRHRVFGKRLVWITAAATLAIAGVLLAFWSTVFREQALSLSIWEPADESVVDVDTVTIRGKTLPNAVVSINGALVTVDSKGTFSLLVSLEEGPNVFYIVATDETGSERVTQLVVHFVP